MRTELTIIYDENIRPVAAVCSACGEEMPKPAPTLQDSADIVKFFSRMFLEHNRVKHSTPEVDCE
jgi:hypothetical protein